MFNGTVVFPVKFPIRLLSLFLFSFTAPPHQPEVKVDATTNSSITIHLKPNSGETEPIHGYTIRYKPDFGEPVNIQIAPNVEKYTIENLWCGSKYQISATAYNR